jgi:asparagine synthase (glutamine-hydrolysing)
MAHSVEARLPILDYPLIETALGLPWNLKIHDGWTKYTLRQAVRELLPSEIVWRRNKIGFEAPWRQWMALIDADIRKALGGELASRAVVDPDRLRRSLAGGRLGDALLWKIYNIEQWFRMFNVTG